MLPKRVSVVLLYCWGVRCYYHFITAFCYLKNSLPWFTFSIWSRSRRWNMCPWGHGMDWEQVFFSVKVKALPAIFTFCVQKPRKTYSACSTRLHDAHQRGFRNADWKLSGNKPAHTLHHITAWASFESHMVHQAGPCQHDRANRRPAATPLQRRPRTSVCRHSITLCPGRARNQLQ